MPLLPLIELKNLSKSFEGSWGRLDIFKNLNLTLRSGESISIRGESGCGKTTLLHILSGIEPFDSGSLYWLGELVEPLPTQSLSKKRGSFLALILQSYHLFSELNVLENIILPRRLCGTQTVEDADQARNLLGKVGLADRALFLPQQLSGGERQRVAIARAFMQGPRVILADEPTGNLDESTGQSIVELMLSLTQEMNVGLIMVTHHVRFAAHMQKQFILEQQGLHAFT